MEGSLRGCRFWTLVLLRPQDLSGWRVVLVPNTSVLLLQRKQACFIIFSGTGKSNTLMTLKMKVLIKNVKLSWKSCFVC